MQACPAAAAGPRARPVRMRWTRPADVPPCCDVGSFHRQPIRVPGQGTHVSRQARSRSSYYFKIDKESVADAFLNLTCINPDENSELGMRLPLKWEIHINGTVVLLEIELGPLNISVIQNKYQRYMWCKPLISHC